MNKGKKIMVFGTFDVLHPGHLNFLEQAKGLGNYLIVVIARDETVKKIKGCFPYLDEMARKEIIGGLKIVNKAVCGDKKDHLKVIVEYKPDAICLGYDQETPKNFQEELKGRGATVKIIRLKAYKSKKYKSSILLNS